MQPLHCASTASSMQVQTPDSRTQRVFVSGALFGTVLVFFAGKTCDASLAALSPSATIYFFISFSPSASSVSRKSSDARRVVRLFPLFSELLKSGLNNLNDPSLALYTSSNEVGSVFHLSPIISKSLIYI